MTIFTESGWIERKRPQNRKKEKKSPVQNRSFNEDNFWYVHQNERTRASIRSI